MFSLKQHARKNAQLVAVGAAASLGLMAASSQAAVLTWDPAPQNPASPNGGSGNFNNTDTNFSNGASDQAAGAGDDVTFNATAGSVTVNAPTTVRTITLNPASGNYSFSGANTITLDGGTATILSNASGNNTISSDITTPFGNVASNIDVASGTSLTIGNLTMGNYAQINKTSAGTLIIGGVTNFYNHGFEALDIKGGTVVLSGPAHSVHPAAPGNGFTANVTAESGTTLSGNAGLRLEGGNTLLIAAGGHLAPGANTLGSNFGGVGTFGVSGPYGSGPVSVVTFASTSNLDLDIASLASYDSVVLTKGNYGTLDANIAAGTVVNINGGVGPAPAAGTYHILTDSSISTKIVITDGGFSIGAAPAGDNYAFQDVTSGGNIIGVDLVVTAGSPVPEPASLALLGLGAGLLFTRKRRGRQL